MARPKLYDELTRSEYVKMLHNLPIHIDGRWRDSYHAFVEDMGLCPPGARLRRKLASQVFTKDNCYWYVEERRS